MRRAHIPESPRECRSHIEQQNACQRDKSIETKILSLILYMFKNL